MLYSPPLPGQGLDWYSAPDDECPAKQIVVCDRCTPDAYGMARAFGSIELPFIIAVGRAADLVCAGYPLNGRAHGGRA